MKDLKMKKVLFLVLAVVFSVFSYAQDAADKLNQAQEAMKAQDYTTAYKLYDEAMSNLGDVQVDESINFNIGYAAYKSENLEGAVKYFDKAIEIGTNVSKCHEYLARLYNDKKEYAKAVENFEKAIEKSEENSDDLFYSAGVSAFKGKLYEKATVMFDTAVEKNYKPEISIYYKALALKQLNKSEDYKLTLEEGIAKFPNDDKISSALSKVYSSEGYEKYLSGKEIIDVANKKVGDGGMTTADDSYLAEVEKGKKDFKAAIPLCEKALKLDAKNEDAKKVLDACIESLK